jgi:hypothetical protein
MTPTDYQTPAYLLQKLSEALGSRQTGTFFVATSDNASCRFCLVQGHITHCSYQRLHGMEALQAFSHIEGGRCSFSPNPYPFRPHDAVEHAQAIALLGINPMPPLSAPTPIVKPVVVVAPLKAHPPKMAPKVKNQYYRGYVMPE